MSDKPELDVGPVDLSALPSTGSALVVGRMVGFPGCALVVLDKDHKPVSAMRYGTQSAFALVLQILSELRAQDAEQRELIVNLMRQLPAGHHPPPPKEGDDTIGETQGNG